MALSRRKFLKTSAAVTAVASLSTPLSALTRESQPFTPAPGNKWPGLIVVNYNNKHNATINGGTTTGTINGTPPNDKLVIIKMVDDTIKLLSNKTDVGEAWKAALPDTLTANSKIAIKVNSYFADIPTHPFVILGIVEGLKQMNFNGTAYPSANITVWDGYSMPFTTHGFTSSLFPGITLKTFSGASTQVIDACDYLINTANPRGHSITNCGGFTIGFKSHYGTKSPNHNSDAQTYLSEINCSGVIYQKTVLTVLAGIYGLRENVGPGGGWSTTSSYAKYGKTKVPDTTDIRPNTVMISTDPVTLEFQAIKMMRIAHGGQYTAAAMPNYLKYSAGMGGSYNIGIIDESKMKYGEIVNEVMTFDPHGTNSNLESSNNQSNQVAAVHVRFDLSKRWVYFDFEVPQSFAGETAQITIVNTAGRVVTFFSEIMLGVHTRAVWDGLNNAGHKVGVGRYVVSARLNGLSLVKQFAMIK